ncbi:MAG: DUF3883 domain-containing protein [Propionibacteriaceae bacterium]|nr:DUF3883 domain-containing protein [Propionibacteriaceae bacterium]
MLQYSIGDGKETRAMAEESVPLAGLRSGLRLTGLLLGQVVTVVSSDLLDTDVAHVVVRDEAGDLTERYLTADQAFKLRVASDTDGMPPFDADPAEFRLAAEALRIKYAALYDPMVAVNSSDVQPLPHQIEAVYGKLLPQVPLRYVLADDPGAGKTIMAGLYIKELILREACQRAIITAPGSLVDQWQGEMASKFDLHFEVLTRQMIDEAFGSNPFARHPLLIVRMDQVSRDDALMEQLADSAWDVAVVDEAHRMSARYWGSDLKTTKRYRLGQVLSETAQNFLMMTATPHAGKEENFQLFMQLLDPDRFEGQYREGVHRTDTTGLMIRRTKEELLTFDGKHLFPERRAETVAYQLSPGEHDLYEHVTEYVRTQMGKADQIARSGDKKRGNTIGFALTILQRRLASSPEAILRSLQRRRDRLTNRLAEMKDLAWIVESTQTNQIERGLAVELQHYVLADDQLPGLDLDDLDDIDDVDSDVTDDERAKFDTQVEQVIDLATAAQTVEELKIEIGVLDDLVDEAHRVRATDEDRKWVELRSILENHVLIPDVTGLPRKIIVFTEHRDTLSYLQQKIGAILGGDAVTTIHGGMNREARQYAQVQFTSEPRVTVLLATDAAGEGLNLQRAHLMVNYDLPWNPNRIEQRFGRIHRIGQREVCHLWNLVADQTREGDVFQLLLRKIDAQAEAYHGNLFNVLGERDAFDNKPLRDLIIEAIKYGDQPEVRAHLEQVIDTACATEAAKLANERMLNPEMYPGLDIDAIRRMREAALERKLQPGYIRRFFTLAFTRLGGLIRERETGRHQISRVPQRLQDQARHTNRWQQLPTEYERATFEPGYVSRDDYPDATLIAPGHPLLDAVIAVTAADLGGTLARGAVFVDRRDQPIPRPSLLYAVDQRIANPKGTTLDHHFDYVQSDTDGHWQVTVAPPYLDYDPPEPAEADRVAQVLAEPWIAATNEAAVKLWAYREGLQPRRAELEARLGVQAERVRDQVTQRLTAEINHWWAEYNRLYDQEQAGKTGRVRARDAQAKATDIEARLARRLTDLDHAADLVELPATVRASALVIPAALVAPAESAAQIAREAKETEEVERRAVDLVLTCERNLGRTPTEMPHFNPGFDIRSTDEQGQTFFIEVKGRLKGGTTFTVTANEIAFAQTQGDRHRLALVTVDPDDPARDEVRYLVAPFTGFQLNDDTRSTNEDWVAYWAKGGGPS